MSEVKVCLRCGGPTIRQLVTAENWWGTELALVEHVPAQVCQQCGEQYFDAATSRELDRIRREQRATRTLAVPVYEYPAPVPTATSSRDR